MPEKKQGGGEEKFIPRKRSVVTNAPKSHQGGQHPNGNQGTTAVKEGRKGNFLRKSPILALGAHRFRERWIGTICKRGGQTHTKKKRGETEGGFSSSPKPAEDGPEQLKSLREKEEKLQRQ